MSVWTIAMVAAKSAVAAPTQAIDGERHRAPRRRGTTAGRPCRRPPSPWWRRGSAPRPGSDRPSRRAARRRAGSAPTCRRRRGRSRARSPWRARQSGRRAGGPVREPHGRVGDGGKRRDLAERERRVAGVGERPEQEEVPIRKPKSPIRLTMKALLAAVGVEAVARTRTRSAGTSRARHPPSRGT